jgi:hypothetical protein
MLCRRHNDIAATLLTATSNTLQVFTADNDEKHSLFLS